MLLLYSKINFTINCNNCITQWEMRIVTSNLNSSLSCGINESSTGESTGS